MSTRHAALFSVRWVYGGKKNSCWKEALLYFAGRLQLKCDGTRWSTGGEVKGKLANGVGSQFPSHYLWTWSITTADTHTSAASKRMNWRPRRFKWTRPFRQNKKTGFCACAITVQMASMSHFLLTITEFSNIRSDISTNPNTQYLKVYEFDCFYSCLIST